LEEVIQKVSKAEGRKKRKKKSAQTAVDGVRPSGSTEREKNNMRFLAWLGLLSGGRWVRWAHRAGRLHIPFRGRNLKSVFNSF
jgi:hypothetical protein